MSDADVAEESGSQLPSASDVPATRGSSWSTAVGVLVLAAGFAIIPRTTKGCEAASLDEDAPLWDAKIVANAAAIAPRPEGDAPARLKLESLRGHPVILDFWATWCGPCQMEAPVMNTIAQRYKDKGLAVVGVNTSDEDGLAAQFVKMKHLGFPVVYDEGNAIAKQYDVSSLPTVVIISKTGKVVAIRQGLTSDSALDEIVRRYL